MRKSHPSKTDLAYLAGFFDGEGCITIDKLYNMRCEVGNTNEWIIKFFQFYFSGSGYRARRKIETTVFWVWYVRGKDATKFLKMILPYLKLKRTEAELAIKFQAQKNSVHYRGRNKVPCSIKILREADRILMQQLKKQVRGEIEIIPSIEIVQPKETLERQLSF